MKGCVISAPMTGSGKTTITIGVLATLASAGLKVQPFKVGPDFIDTGLHELATGVTSHNLDGWMLSRETNVALFAKTTAGKDVAIVEGVMGLFDGAEGASNIGSTAEMASWLDLPIILVVDAHALARSAAAIIHGFRTFDPSVRIAGIIFNRIAGESHFQLLSDAVKDVPILGWLPHNPEIEIRERHLGLLTAGEPEARIRVERIRDFFASHIDIDRVVHAMADVSLVQGTTPALRATPPDSGGVLQGPALRANPEPGGIPRLEKQSPGDESAPTARSAAKSSPPESGGETRKARRGGSLSAQHIVRVALAHDPAFSFYYQANRDALEAAGARIIEFSPITDSTLPDADFLYIGGGYPELYRHELEANRSMRDSVRNFVESGKRFYAECGGLMYLAKSIDHSEMVGVVPTEIQLMDRPVDFGYCEIITRQPSIFGPASIRLRGHQFHYSRCVVTPTNPIYTVKQRTREYGEGWPFPNGIASYVHLHFLSNPVVVRSMLES